MKTYQIFIGSLHITTVQADDTESALAKWAEYEGCEHFSEMNVKRDEVELYEV